MNHDEKIKTSELRYRRLFEAAQDGILILDSKTGMIEDVNPYLIKMLGYSREEFVKKKLWEMGAFKDVEASKKAFETLQENEFIRYDDLPLKAKDGKLVEVEFVSNVYLVNEEKVIQCNIRDITERKKAQADLLKSQALLREQSTRDYLTGLFNRRYLEETLERELLRSARKRLPLGLIMLDVDDFKRFNDIHGHVVGDTILRGVGSLLLSHVRREDVPCRYGGDEFIIILPDAPQAVIHERARLLCEKAKQFDYRFEGQTLNNVTLSLGIATFPKHGVTGDELLRSADSALYRAKHAGRDQIVVAS
ncbi:MAG: GGDEF domain-containing protein [Anaerolineales bacterium]|nr:GGDEF domain-containing protein [Anaerolineales bacterium]MCB9145347.1 GGDEF domain-containing protein [Anaerolineales bacterium]